MLVAAVGLASLANSLATASDPVVRIIAPDGSSPVFGDIEVVTEVDADEPINWVSLRVDGVPIGRLTEVPYTFRVRLGEENLAHHFEVVALTGTGRRGWAAVSTPDVHVDEVVDVALQQVYATVTGPGGKRVLDLNRSDFRLYDDGRPQEIVTFAGGEIPFSALLLIDGSESMRGPQMLAAKEGARAFLRGMNELDEAKVMVFSTVLQAVTDFAGPKEPLGRFIDEVEPTGGTAINDFIFLGLRLLEEQHGRRVMVLLSDGWDAHSVLGMQQVTGIAHQSQAQIFWLRLDAGRGSAGDFVGSWRSPTATRDELKTLKRVIKESGGRILAIKRPDEIDEAFQQVLAELRDQYAIGYYPDRRFDDGRWRRLEIEVEGRYRVKAREGYLDLP